MRESVRVCECKHLGLREYGCVYDCVSVCEGERERERERERMRQKLEVTQVSEFCGSEY